MQDFIIQSSLTYSFSEYTVEQRIDNAPKEKVFIRRYSPRHHYLPLVYQYINIANIMGTFENEFIRKYFAALV